MTRLDREYAALSLDPGLFPGKPQETELRNDGDVERAKGDAAEFFALVNRTSC